MFEKEASNPFYLCDGREVRSLPELVYNLVSSDDSVFTHHVNQERNDFSNWIRDVFKNRSLASKIAKLKDREEVVGVLSEALNLNLKKQVSDELAFSLIDGRKLKSIKELHDSISNMEEAVFTHHVNQERNDFSNWIRDVFGDKKLSANVKMCKSKLSLANSLRRALK